MQGPHQPGQITENNIVAYISVYPIPRLIRGHHADYLLPATVSPDVEFCIVLGPYSLVRPGEEAGQPMC